MCSANLPATVIGSHSFNDRGADGGALTKTQFSKIVTMLIKPKITPLCIRLIREGLVVLNRKEEAVKS